LVKLLAKLPALKISFMILLLFIPLFFFYLGVPGLWEIDESIYADISREMLSGGDYVGTYFNYEPRYDKPPLSFWIDAVSFKIFGLTEFAARFGSALFGLFGLALVFAVGKRLFGKEIGISAAFIMGASFLYFIETQLAIIDTALTFFITLSLYWFYRGYVENDQKYLILMGIPLGLGILAKGPVSLVLPAAIALFFWVDQVFIAKNKRRGLFSWSLGSGLIIALAIALPWYLAMWNRFGTDFLQSHFGYHMIRRFAGAIEGHGGAWYFSLYYVIMLFIGFLPWSAGIPGSVTAAFINRSLPQVRLILIWFGVIFGFFSIAQTKLQGYILPAFPTFALMLAYWWNQLWSGKTTRSGVLWWGTLLQTLIAFLFTALLAGQKSRLPAGYDQTVRILYTLPLSLILGAIIGIFAFLRRKNYRHYFTVTFITFYLFWAMFLLMLVPVIENFKPVKYLAAQFRDTLLPRDLVISQIPGSMAAPFYTRHPVVFLGTSEAGNIRLAEMFRGRRRVFAMVEVGTIDYLKSRRLRYYLISRHGSGYLLSNRELKEE